MDLKPNLKTGGLRWRHGWTAIQSSSLMLMLTEMKLSTAKIAPMSSSPISTVQRGVILQKLNSKSSLTETSGSTTGKHWSKKSKDFSTPSYKLTGQKTKSPNLVRGIWTLTHGLPRGSPCITNLRLMQWWANDCLKIKFYLKFGLSYSEPMPTRPPSMKLWQK